MEVSLHTKIVITLGFILLFAILVHTWYGRMDHSIEERFARFVADAATDSLSSLPNERTAIGIKLECGSGSQWLSKRKYEMPALIAGLSSLVMQPHPMQLRSKLYDILMLRDHPFTRLCESGLYNGEEIIIGIIEGFGCYLVYVDVDGPYGRNTRREVLSWDGSELKVLPRH